ncbi:MAG: TldD/PmbA family protein [Spirochaetes bacterium]|nr:TldD/PmbA family protein [Spirochaetota bacterium]
MKAIDTDFLDTKCRWYDIVEYSSRSTPISFKNNRLYSIRESANSGVGLRVNAEGKTGISYTNDSNGLGGLAQRAVQLAAYGDSEAFDLPKSGLNYSNLERPERIVADIDEEIAKGEEVISLIEKSYPDAEINMSVSAGESSSILRNSNGLEHHDSSHSYSASCSATVVLEDGTRIETGHSLSAYNPIDIGELSREIVSRLDMSIRPAKLSSGRVPLILTPRAFASVLYILIGGLSAEQIYRKISPYQDKIGTALFDPKFTLIDDPLKADSPYSYACDDEGVVAKRRALIEGGVVKECISDLKYAALTGGEPTGHSSRSYAGKPSASFSNLEVLPGELSSAEMLAGCDRAILAHQFIGLGQSNTFKGDFSANLDLGFLVEKGEIVGRVKDCMISDNLFSMFEKGVDLSLDVKNMSGLTLPYIMFDGVNFTG